MLADVVISSSGGERACVAPGVPILPVGEEILIGHATLLPGSYLTTSPTGSQLAQKWVR